MNIGIVTHIDGTPAILASQRQYVDEFTVGIYQRRALHSPIYFEVLFDRGGRRIDLGRPSASYSFPCKG